MTAADMMQVDSSEAIVVTEYDEILEIVEIRPQEAATRFHTLLLKEDGEDADGSQRKTKELCIYRLGELYVRLQEGAKLKQLLVEIRPFFDTIPKARTATIVKKLIDLVGELKSAGAIDMQAQLCQDCIEWCRVAKRAFLKMRIENRYAELLFRQAKFKVALKIVQTLVHEIKKIDDKQLLVEVLLLETRIHHALRNYPVAKSSLTGARATSNAIYCEPLVQAQIDMMAGILQSEERDYKTAFSYFYETFEGHNTLNKPREATLGLKYMMMAKILQNQHQDVFSIANGKSGLKYAGPDVTAMTAIAQAYTNRSLKEFEQIVNKYPTELKEDPIVSRHLDRLYESLLEKNILQVCEPFSKVEIKHVAKLMDMSHTNIEAKLSQMILDKKLLGILDQGTGNLIIYDEIGQDPTYDATIKTIGELSNVVDQLHNKAKTLH